MQLPNVFELLALEVRTTGVLFFLLTRELEISSWSKPHDKSSLKSLLVSLVFSSSLLLWLKKSGFIEFEFEDLMPL